MKEHTFGILPILSAIVFLVDFFASFLLVVSHAHVFCGVLHEVFTLRVLGESISIVVLTLDELDFNDSIINIISGVMVSSVNVFRAIRRCRVIS